MIRAKRAYWGQWVGRSTCLEAYRHEFNPKVLQEDRRESSSAVLYFPHMCYCKHIPVLFYMYALNGLPIKPVENANIFLMLFKKLNENKPRLISEKR